jgi:ribonuclease Z
MITLADGSTVRPEQVLGPEQPGARLAFVGDAATTRGLYPIARDADALVIEATYRHSEADLAREFGHLTARQAAELARDAGIHALILTHLSRRYAERDVLADARDIFANTFIARDFDHFEISKGGDVKMIRPG